LRGVAVAGFTSDSEIWGPRKLVNVRPLSFHALAFEPARRDEGVSVGIYVRDP
jgi:hypothetical protein